MKSLRTLSPLVLLAGSLVLAADAPPKVVASPAASKPVKSAEIRGQVAGADGKPIAGATVRVVESKQKMGGAWIGNDGRKSKPVVVKTAGDGSFSATGLKGSMFAVRVEHPGLAPSVSWQIPPEASLHIQLRPGAFASGRVFDAGTRKPVAGASVLVWDRDASPFGSEAGRRTVTGEDGRFRIGDIPPGVAYAEVTSPAYAVGRFDQILVRESTKAADETVEPEEPSIFLRPGGRVAGRVSGADGKGIEGAMVVLRPVSLDTFADYASYPRPATTDTEGRFTLEGVPAEASKRKIVASKDGFAGAESAPLVIDAGTNRLDVELRLEAGATLKFRLVDADDLPVTDSGLSLAPSGGARRDPGAVWLDADSVDNRLKKGPDGTFTLKALDAGTFSLTIMPGGYEDIEREAVRLKNGETTDLGTIRLREGRAISGAVTDTSGQPIAKATVRARWMDDGNRWKAKAAKTGENGRYKLGGLSSAPLRSLWFSAKGYSSKERSGGATPGDTNVDFVLEKAGTIVGKVLLADGTPPLAFFVKVHAEARDDSQGGMSRVSPEETSTDPAGNFTLEGIGTGSVTVEAISKGKVPARKSGVKVVSDRIADVGTLTLVEGRTLRGRVVAASDASPVPGATIVASQAQGTMAMRFGGAGGLTTAMSDGDGSFEISGLESRPYSLSVTHPEWAPSESQLDVPEAEDPPEQAIRLSRGGTLTGTVRDAAKQPVADMRITLQGMSGGSSRSAVSGPDGRYNFERLSAGTYSVMRAPEGDRLSLSNMGVKPATIRDGETTVVDFDETAKITVSGRILRSGKPVAKASLGFLPGAAGDVPTEFKGAESDAEGRFQIGLDKAGPYQVIVQVGGMLSGASAPITIQVPDQPVVTQDIVVPGSGVAGRVIDGEGKPVADVLVRALRDGADESSRFGSMAGSDAEGAWRLEGLEPGTYRITASAAGYRNAEAYPIAVGTDAAPSVELRLERGRSFRGRVVDPMGRPMPEAMVTVAPAGVTEMSFSMIMSDINGVFVATAPGEGALDITAGAVGYGAGRANGFVPTGGSEEPEFTLRLTPGGRVRVLVTGSDGKPVAGAQIVPRAKPAFLGSEFGLLTGRQTPTTGPDGVATLGPLTAGGYELTAMDGARNATQSVSVADGGESRVTIVLP